MDIRKLKYFVSAAETLNFTRSAQEHNISQSAISQYIATMEKELDFRLFHRGKGRLDLTRAGQAFYEDAKVITQKYDRAVERGTAAAKDDSVLRIVYSNPMDMDFLSLIIDEFVGRHPDARVDLEKRNFTDIAGMLEDDLCDFAFTFPYDLEKVDGLRTLTICEKKLCLIVGRKHARAGAELIEGSEIGKERIVMISPENGRGHYQHILDCCRGDGYEPNIVEEVKDYDSYILMVEANKGIGFVSDLNSEVLSRNVALVGLKNSCHQYEIVAAWKKNQEEGLENDFIRTIKKKLKSYKKTEDPRFPFSIGL